MPVPFSWRGQHARLAWRATEGEALPLLCLQTAPHRGVAVARRAFSDHAASAAMLRNIREGIDARAYAYTEAQVLQGDEERPTCIFLHSSRAPEFRLIWQRDRAPQNKIGSTTPREDKSQDSPRHTQERLCQSEKG